VRMVLSGKAVAYWALLIKMLGFFMLPFDWVCSRIEHTRKVNLDGPSSPPVFVIGLQRTGSTAVAQAIALALGYTPIGNAVSIFPQSLLPHRFLSRYLDHTPNKVYPSFYGIARGLFTVGDCYEFWDQWFGPNHYEIDQVPTTEQLSRLKDRFAQYEQIYGKPVISKNNRNSLALDILYKVFPEAHFVIVSRNEFDTVRSTIRASEDFFGGQKPWGLKTTQTPHGNPASIANQIISQHKTSEQVVTKLSRQIPSRQFSNVNFEDFCLEPDRVISTVVSRITGAPHTLQRIPGVYWKRPADDDGTEELRGKLERSEERTQNNS